MASNFPVQRYKQRAYRKKKSLKSLLDQLGRKRKLNLDTHMKGLASETWKEMACLDCANCCKTMTPTYTKADVKRISAHFGLSTDEFYTRWLAHDSNGDIINEKTPCQFLGKDNKCSIYEIRPHDCRSFPHFHKKPILDQSEVLINNLHRCPATLVMLEKMDELARSESWIK